MTTTTAAAAATPPPPLWRRIALAFCMFLTVGVNGILMPFVPLYFAAAGLTKSEIGWVTGLGTGAAMLIQPLLGRLSDRIDARRPVMFVAGLLAGAAYLSYNHSHTFAAFLVLTAIGVNGFQYLNSVGGVLIGRLVSATSGGASRSTGAVYARYRVWGSVGFIAVTLTTGLLLRPEAGLTREQLAPVFAYGPLLFFVAALVSLVVPDVRLPAPDTPAGGAASPEAVTRDAEGRGERNLRRFLAAYFLYTFALYGASSYISLFLKTLEASPRWITAVFAAGVISEVLVMSQIGRWTDIYGRRPALAAAFLLMPLRLLLYIPATGPLWVLLVQSLHGLNFGIVGAVAVVFVNDHANDRQRGAFQARLTGTAGLALAISPVVCGWLAQRYGIGAMFGAMSAVGAIGAAVFLFLVEESHPEPEALRGPVGRFLARPVSPRKREAAP